MIVSIINIGDELLIGQVVNTNASKMSRMLVESGMEVHRVYTVGDNGRDIAAAIKEAVAGSDAVLLTGGLGPTKDDITKHVLCELFDSKLYENSEALDNVKRIFKARGFELTPINRQQSWVPECCEMINNDVGTAPAMLFDIGCSQMQSWFPEVEVSPSVSKVLVSMPGVPSEMEYLMRHRIIPCLKLRFETEAIVNKNVIVHGIGESFLSDLIEPWELALPSNIKLAYLPDAGMVKLRLTARGSSEAQLREQIAKEMVGLYDLAGQYIVGEDVESLPELVACQFVQAGVTLATAESCTGGAIATCLTALPGASEYFKGGIVAYSNEVKQSALGVGADTLHCHGAVSEATVREMAEGARCRLGADYAVATSGIAGPGGGTDSKPVGTVWMAVASPTETEARLFHFNGQRQQIINRTVHSACAWLLHAVKKK
ncbi:MAG: CinA family nicotinamide mononucleotide deamidase-related protein [Bacteroidales bacterium]|nr:CinA family nicotinamide mononucleotide deamidase-related protein [Candidatus Colimorpha onthohippi]